MSYLDDDRIILHKGSIDRAGARRYNKKTNVSGNYVVELQEDLLQLGFGSGSADGCFGSRTEEALREDMGGQVLKLEYSCQQACKGTIRK
jgi:hypothetical protein